MSPINEVDFFDQGREYIKKSDSKIEIILCDETSKNSESEFSVEITNIDTKSVFVDPVKFCYLFSNKNIDYQIFTKNSENEISRVDKSIIWEHEDENRI